MTYIKKMNKPRPLPTNRVKPASTTTTRTQTQTNTLQTEAREQEIEHWEGEGKCYRCLGYSLAVPYILLTLFYAYCMVDNWQTLSSTPATAGLSKQQTISAQLEQTVASESVYFRGLLLPFMRRAVELAFHESIFVYVSLAAVRTTAFALLCWFVVSVSYHRVNQHVYTAIGFGNATARRVVRSVIRKMRGLSCFFFFNGFVSIVSLPLLLEPASLVFRKHANGQVPGLLTSLRFYSLLLEAPLALYIICIAIATAFINRLATPFPDLQLASCKLGGLCFLLLFPVVLALVLAGFGVYLSILSFYCSDMTRGASFFSSLTFGKAGLKFLVSLGLLALLFLYPLFVQLLQLCSMYACPANKSQTYEGLLTSEREKYTKQQKASGRTSSYQLAYRRALEERKRTEISKKTAQIEEKYRKIREEKQALLISTKTKEAAGPGAKKTASAGIEPSKQPAAVKPLPIATAAEGKKQAPIPADRKQPAAVAVVAAGRRGSLETNATGRLGPNAAARKQAPKPAPQAPAPAPANQTSPPAPKPAPKAPAPTKQPSPPAKQPSPPNPRASQTRAPASSGQPKKLVKYTPGSPTKMAKPKLGSPPDEGPLRLPTNYEFKNKRFQK